MWGLQHVTVTGYIIVNLLRLNQALRVFGHEIVHFNHIHSATKNATIWMGSELQIDVFSFPDLWVLLHMATLVRLVAYYVSPWTSFNGNRTGDLLTDPVVYTFSVTVAALVTLGFVYSPSINFIAVVILSIAHVFLPSKVGRSFDRLMAPPECDPALMMDQTKKDVISYVEGKEAVGLSSKAHHHSDDRRDNKRSSRSKSRSRA